MKIKGIDKALKEIDGYIKRVKDPRSAFTIIGKMLVSRHLWYFRRCMNQRWRGGGPPEDEWPGLEESTVVYKESKNKTKKLINKGILLHRFQFKVDKTRLLFWNDDWNKMQNLQVEGVGRNKKKFAVVATDIGNQDPEFAGKASKLMHNFLFTGELK